MARFLAIDWDQPALRVVLASGSTSGVRALKAFSWTAPADFSAATAESAGRAFREALKKEAAAGLGVWICLGRDRLLLRDIEFPPVQEHEEPALVRFQAAREMGDGSEEQVLDYCITRPGVLGRESRQAVVLAVKKSLLQSLQAFCQGAGLKLEGVTARPFAWLGALQRGQVDLQGTIASLGIGQRQAELCVFESQKLLLARSLPLGAMLAGEVTRNLALFGVRAGAAVRSLTLAGIDDPQLKTAAAEVGVLRQPASDASDDYAAALGLAHLVSTSVPPINWLRPKQPRPVRQRKKEYAYLGVFLTVAAALVLCVVGFLVLRNKRLEIGTLEKMKKNLADEHKALEKDLENIAYLRDWENASISWADESYDLAARMPHLVGLHLNQLNAKVTLNPAQASKKKNEPREKWVANMNFSGWVPPKHESELLTLQKSIQSDKHLRLSPGKRNAADKKSGEFEYLLDIAKQPASEYRTELIVPKKVEPPAEIEEKKEEVKEGGES